MKKIFAAILVSLAVMSVDAEEASTRTYDRVDFAVSAREEISSDLLVVRLVARHEALQQADSSARVNDDVAWALALARKRSGVKIQTLDYRTNPVYEERQIRGWRTQQVVRLESQDRDVLASLIGELQQRLTVESLIHEVSAELRETVETRLIDDAIARFGSRAAQIAQAFSRASYRLVAVHIGTADERPPPVNFGMRAMAMSAQAAEPNIEPGEQTIVVTVDGTIELETR